MKASIQDVRRLAIVKQHLAGSPPPRPSRNHIFRVIRDLAYIQIDPISVVARSHELILWSRVGKYDLQDLQYLLWKERKIFEYLGHAASIVLTEDYEIHSARIRAYVSGHGLPNSWHIAIQKWMKRNDKLRLYVLEELRRRGPQFLARSKTSPRELGVRQDGRMKETSQRS
ncbi:MAG: crosslink repair DNA glycosylase YcaQ family protein [archaeon]|nr:crosslink repair DNA glycosylase YcaQ family protein [archaeon]